MGATLQINPIWAYGPYNPSEVTAGSQPDWYMGFVEGAVRILPNWESTFFNYTWSWNVFLPGAILPGLLPRRRCRLAVHRAVDHRRQA